MYTLYIHLVHICTIFSRVLKMENAPVFTFRSRIWPPEPKITNLVRVEGTLVVQADTKKCAIDINIAKLPLFSRKTN